MWDKMVFEHRNQSLSKSDFTRSLARSRKRNEDIVKKELVACYKDLASLQDTNMDGVLSKIEVKDMFKIFGVNKKIEGLDFKSFGKPDGIPLTEYAESWVEFTTKAWVGSTGELMEQ